MKRIFLVIILMLGLVSSGWAGNLYGPGADTGFGGGGSLPVIISSATYSTAPAVGSSGQKIIYKLTAQNAGVTFGVPTGTPTDGQMLEIVVLDNGSAQTLAFSSSTGGYAASTVALPTTTVISTQIRILFQYDTTANKWYCVGVA